MPFKNSDWLPSYEELEVQEIEMSTPALRAGAHHFGKYCDNQSKEFILCYQETNDPRKCLNEGKQVTKCGLEFFRKVKQHCAAEFTDYWQCIDHSGFDMSYRNCRKTQAKFDECIKTNLGQDRPELGYFAKVRVHKTNRPKPEKIVPLPERVPGPEDIDKTKPVPESVKTGSRIFLN